MDPSGISVDASASDRQSSASSTCHLSHQPPAHFFCLCLCLCRNVATPTKKLLDPSSIYKTRLSGCHRDWGPSLVGTWSIEHVQPTQTAPLRRQLSDCSDIWQSRLLIPSFSLTLRFIHQTQHICHRAVLLSHDFGQTPILILPTSQSTIDGLIAREACLPRSGR